MLTAMHRRAGPVARPLAFRPERFLDGRPRPYSYMPFGGGIRHCIGASLSLVELRTVLRTAIGMLDVLPAPGREERHARSRGITLTPLARRARGAAAALSATRARIRAASTAAFLGLSIADAGDRHARRHLRDRQQRVEPAGGGHAARERDADHRQVGVRGDDARQRGRQAGAGDDHLQARASARSSRRRRPCRGRGAPTSR